MKFQPTTATDKIFKLRKRIRCVAGGTGASKTISILVWIIDYAQSTRNELISVASESYPHLKMGAILDFESIMKDRGYWRDSRWHDTEHTYTFETGTKLQFFSPDTYGKAHGPRRDILFLNECNNLQWPIVQQLMLRTRKCVWMDWNPSSEFWYYTELEGKRDDVDFLHLTFLDNESLDEGERKEIMAMKDNKYLWDVYGLGILSEAEGKVFKNWKIIDSVPHEARLISYGIDFGYTNDPTGICQLYYLNGGYIVHEIAYQRGMNNKNIADIIKALEVAPVIADAAEPKSIDELRLYGITVIPSTKGKGAVHQRIVFVQSQKVSITKSSVNFIKSYRNYMFITDKNGKVTNEPHHTFSHGMDSVGYAFQIKRGSDKPSYQQPEWENPMQGDYSAPDELMPSDYRPILKIGEPSFRQPAWQSPMNGDSGEESSISDEESLTGLRSI